MGSLSIFASCRLPLLALAWRQEQLEDNVVQFGPYCRWETPNFQTREVAKMQAETGEIWGRTPNNGGMEPTVQAYPYPLAENQRGIEFTTDTAAQPNQSPQEIRWYLYKTPGVLLRQKDGQDFACILAEVDNRQP